MTSLANRALRVAASGIVPADDPHVIADMQARIDMLSHLLRMHSCQSRGNMTVGQCIKSRTCGCTCGLVLK